jgi:hypothetical protein
MNPFLKVAGLAVFGCFAAAVDAAAQEAVRPDAVSSSVSLWNAGTEEGDPLQGARRSTTGSSRHEQPFTLGFRVEYWESALEVTDSSNTAGDPASTVESGLDDRVLHTLGLLYGEYTLGWTSSALKLGAGIGWERIGSHQEADATNQYGTYDYDVTYDGSVAFQGSAFYQHLLPGADIGGGVLVRFGGSERKYSDNSGKETYDYRLVRFSAEAGLRSVEGVRPFIGMRYTLYLGEYEFDDLAGFQVSYDFELDQPFGVSVGVDLEGGMVAGRLELMFLDVEQIGFAASIGWKF